MEAVPRSAGYRRDDVGEAAPPMLASALWQGLGRPRVSIVICTLNERESIAHVLPNIPQWVHEVLVVDGRSCDGTVEAIGRLRPDVRVLYQPGSGKGDAMRYGVAQATGDIIVTLDADGETDPRDLPRFLEPLLSGYDFAKGSRFAAGRANKPLYRRFGNWVIVTVCNLLYGTSYTDLCSGYNAFWSRVSQRVNLWSEDGWNYEPSIIAKALKAGLRVKEVAQVHRGRIGGRSKLPNFFQAYKALQALVGERFRG